ncbi:hypothetical protein, partial [Faecalibaculum rodentium]|uniref:hypothetical protein n=2 Tax=Faecalibaculum rodentium TaxID=1702221 RepID=UPI002637ADBA
GRRSWQKLCHSFWQPDRRFGVVLRKTVAKPLKPGAVFGILPAALGLGHQMRVCEADIGILPAVLGWGHVLNSKKMQYLRTVPKGQRTYKQKEDR